MLKLITDKDQFKCPMTTLLLFRKRGTLGFATHYIMCEEWWRLTYQQFKEVRTEFEQVMR